MKKILFTIAATSLIIFGACKKEEDKKDDPTGGGGTAAEPTLDKNLLTNSGKIWQPQANNPKLDFKANGVFSNSGTWVWLNNSDSMEIKMFASGPTLVWYFNYCQGDSMEARTGSSGAYTKFRDRDW